MILNQSRLRSLEPTAPTHRQTKIGSRRLAPTASASGLQTTRLLTGTRHFRVTKHTSRQSGIEVGIVKPVHGLNGHHLCSSQPRVNKLSPRTARLHARKRVLLLRLGGRCACCPNTVDLEFDCIQPRGHWHHVCGSSARMSFYENEADAGNLQLLCKFHHRQKTSEEFRKRKSRSPRGSSPFALDSLTASNL